MEDKQVKYAGVAVFMDGQEYIVPSFSVRQYRDYSEKLSEPPSEGQSAGDYMCKQVPLIGVALRRNYPSLSDEQLLDMVDLNTFRELVRAVQAASGMKVARPGEAVPVAAN